MRLHQVFARETMYLGERISLKISSFEDGNEKRDTLKWFFNNYYKTRRLQFDAGLPQHTTRHGNILETKNILRPCETPWNH
mmetsp:Transcript_20081/g.22741  ORF Transcript_20081/g.22741 Transcript_20081/m.22741 type:complete len:81 (+) Transcript_20081:274-516(+)